MAQPLEYEQAGYNSPDGVQIGKSSAEKVGIFGAVPVAQQSTTGTVTGFTSGTGTTVVHASTFTGNSGSTAYTVGDVVLALKNMGVLAP